MFVMRADLGRRTIDILLASAGLLVLSPIFVLIGVFIKVDSRGPVLYRAPRVGKDGTPFEICKFRSMRVGSDRAGPPITFAGDSRVTKVGRILRQHKLDELPQLLNVLKGEMSLVGPRPEDPRYVALYTKAQRELLRVRPGITSPASLAFRNESEQLTGPSYESHYIESVLPAKLAIELEYFGARSLLKDLTLVTRTIILLVHRGR